MNGSSPPGAQRGDLVESVSPRGVVTRVTAYDVHGMALATDASGPGGGALVVNRTYDDRGRLRVESNSLGHHVVKDYDANDLPILTERKNTKGVSPGVATRFIYYPGGQVRTETNGLGLVRTVELDALNRPRLVTESGGGLADALVTEYRHDEAGNRTQSSTGAA